MEILTTGIELWLDGGRKGPTGKFSPEQLAKISRVVGGSREVFVRVSGGGKTRAAVRSDLAYIGQYGRADIETDRGDAYSGPDAPEKIVDRWDVDLARGLGRYRQSVSITLAMPAGTPPEKVLDASRQFATQHLSPNFRWALALHVDKPHPHVHIVVKSEGRDGKRLRINRETLREYRSSFAEKMRAQGIEANATLNAARGKFRTVSENRAVSHLMTSGKSRVIKELTQDALRDLASGKDTPEPIKTKLVHIRHDVMLAWVNVMRQLKAEGHNQLAADVGKFVARFEPVRTARERVKDTIRDKLREKIKENRALEVKQDGPIR